MNQFGIGQSLTRIEDERFLTGKGNYVADINLPGQTYAHILRSPHPHARILSIDTSNALKVEGVLEVLTGQNVVADGLGGIPCSQLSGDGGMMNGVRTHQPILAINEVRFVGEGIAMVIAETVDQAKSAIELIEVDYAALSFITEIEQAIEPGALLVWEQAAENVCFKMELGDADAVALAMEKADHIHKVSVRNNRIAACPLEPRATLGDYKQGRFNLHSTCQKPHVLRQLLSGAIFHQPEEKFRITCPDVGGGFGLKGTVYPEDALVLWAAKKVERPVKWVAERYEAFISDTHARDQIAVGSLALDAGGNILALDVSVTANLGAYLSISALVPTARCAMNLSNVYAIPAIHVVARSVFTHTTPLGPYRGAGLPEAVYLLERLMDVTARKTGRDVIDFRRQNLIKPSDMPYQTALPYLYDSGDFETILNISAQNAQLPGFAERRALSEKYGKLRGIGIGLYIGAITPFNERMEIRINANCDVTVLAGTFSYGQGHATIYAQMVSEWLGTPPEKVHLVQGDTDRVSQGRGSFGSRSITMGGAALKQAADIIIEKAQRIAAQMLESAEADIEFVDGVFKVSGTDRSVHLHDVAHRAFAPLGLPSGSGIGLEGTGYFDGPFNFPNGSHICEVEVDPVTGKVDVKNYIAVDDIGTVVNPLLAAGQIHGGIAQGLGQALQENMVFDKKTGQILSGSLMDYQLPRAADMPYFQVEFHEAPTETNPLGVKGAGENGCLPSPPALINAILDALSPLGVTDLEMPVTSEHIWQAIQAAAN
jgi:carbon-monoxide dehydrogenase large subunit